MSQQAQIFVEKQGSMQKSNWSSRILTIDTATGTATVSRKNDPHKALHHTLRVYDVRKFPNVDLAHSKINPKSIEAQWTLCLLGSKAPVLKLSQEQANTTDTNTTDTPTKQKTNAKGQQRDSSESSASTPNSETRSKKSPIARSRDNGEDVYDRWLIRCTSQDTYDLAVRLLEKILHASNKDDANQPHGASNPV